LWIGTPAALPARSQSAYVYGTDHPQDWPHGPVHHALKDLFPSQRILPNQHRLEAFNDGVGVVAQGAQCIAKKGVPLDTLVGDDSH
jgi:hypothetical protein